MANFCNSKCFFGQSNIWKFALAGENRPVPTLYIELEKYNWCWSDIKFWRYPPCPGIKYFLRDHPRSGLVISLLSIYQIGLGTGSRPIFGWYETRMYLVRIENGIKAGMHLVISESLMQIQGWYCLRASLPPQWQTLLSIKSCSRIVQILLLAGIDGPFCNGHFNPLKVLFSTKDLDSDYYSPRCEDINGLLSV